MNKTPKAVANKVFAQKRQILADKNLSLKIRKNIARSYVRNILFYSHETRILRDKKKLKLMKMWILKDYFVLGGLKKSAMWKF